MDEDFERMAEALARDEEAERREVRESEADFDEYPYAFDYDGASDA